MEVGEGCLLSNILLDVQRTALSARGADARTPFAIAPVKDENRIRVLQAQHVQKIVRLLACRIQPGSGDETVRHEEPLSPEVVAQAEVSSLIYN